MLVAKAIGIGYQFVMDDKKEEEVYFGQEDMQRNIFVVNEVKKLKKIRTSQHLHSTKRIHHSINIHNKLIVTTMVC